VGISVAVVSSFMGSFMILRRMALVGDALSHVALPGIAIALSFGVSPLLGAMVTLFISLIGIWWLEETSNTYPEAIVGIFFTASLALGILLTDEAEVFEALFGNIEKITFFEGLFTIFICLLVFLLIYGMRKKFIVFLISEELAKTTGIDVKLYNLLYLICLGFIVGVGIRFVGTLLTGALVIIPPVAAKNLAWDFKTYHLFSILIAAVSSALGILIAFSTNQLVGPCVVLTSTFIFLITYTFNILKKKKPS